MVRVLLQVVVMALLSFDSYSTTFNVAQEQHPVVFTDDEIIALKRHYIDFKKPDLFYASEPEERLKQMEQLDVSSTPIGFQKAYLKFIKLQKEKPSKSSSEEIGEISAILRSYMDHDGIGSYHIDHLHHQYHNNPYMVVFPFFVLDENRNKVVAEGATQNRIRNHREQTFKAFEKRLMDGCLSDSSTIKLTRGEIRALRLHYVDLQRSAITDAPDRMEWVKQMVQLDISATPIRFQQEYSRLMELYQKDDTISNKDLIEKSSRVLCTYLFHDYEDIKYIHYLCGEYLPPLTEKEYGIEKEIEDLTELKEKVGALPCPQERDAMIIASIKLLMHFLKADISRINDGKNVVVWARETEEIINGMNLSVFSEPFKDLLSNVKKECAGIIHRGEMHSDYSFSQMLPCCTASFASQLDIPFWGIENSLREQFYLKFGVIKDIEIKQDVIDLIVRFYQEQERELIRKVENKQMRYISAYLYPFR